MWPETVDLGDLPDLGSWLRVAEQEIAFLLVQVDRTGGDIDFYRALARPRSEHQTVEGASYYIRKVPQGDWAQKQFQQGAEELWKKNAREVADHVRTLARANRPQAILVGGDVRAVTGLVDALETGGDVPVVKLESGGRAAGISEDALWKEISVVLADFEAHGEKETADDLAEAAGRDRGAAIASTRKKVSRPTRSPACR